MVKALQNGKCISYWTNTGAMDEVKDYLKYNTMDVREDVIKMVSGYEVDITIDEEFRAGQEAPKTEIVEGILHDIHNSEIPILQYWKSDSLHSLDKFREPNHRFGSSLENSLSCVVTLAYLSARDTYRVEREEKTGKGFADFTFHPRRKADTPFILELKKDETVDIAIKQMKEKEYFQKFIKYHENVLAVAICYDSKMKEHSCKIERINL